MNDGATKTGRWPLFIPGLPYLLRARRVTGYALLALTLFILAVLFFARHRILGTLARGGLDDWVALVTLVLALLVTWLVNLRAPGGPWAPAEGGASLWADASRDFSRNRLAVIGVWVLVLFSLVTLLAPYLAPYDPIDIGDVASTRYLPPSPAHLMGTDRFGRDVFTRVIFGARISLAIGFTAVTLSITLGTAVGAASGYFGGWVDAVLMRFVDVLIAFPRLVLLIVVISLFGASVPILIIVLGLTLWPSTARIVRGEVLSLREREFIQAARALGFSDLRIIARHIAPNVMAPVIVAATLGIGNVILIEAGLSFLGFGVPIPTPSWGRMLSEGRDVLINAWWIATFPGLAIVFTVVAFNLIGDGLRDALDPRLRL